MKTQFVHPYLFSVLLLPLCIVCLLNFLHYPDQFFEVLALDGLEVMENCGLRSKSLKTFSYI